MSNVLNDSLSNVLNDSLSNGIDAFSTKGPILASATRVTNVITATITHDGGTDFTPTTGIEGFYYLKADGTNIEVSSAEQASATTITITLASDPGGAGTLYYIYDSPTITALTNLVHDNHAKAYPLQRGSVTVA